MAAGYSDFRYAPLGGLEPVDMYLAFSDAFAAYPMPFSMTLEEFTTKFIHRLKVNFEYSAGVWEGNSLAGFVMVRLYGSRLYYAAVGIRKFYQGRGLIGPLLAFQHSLTEGLGAKSVWLEVLPDYDRARNIYEKAGFSIHRKLCSYEGTIRSPERERLPLTGTRVIPWDTVRPWMEHEPSFMNSEAVVEAGSLNEKAWIYADNAGAGALLVLNTRSGRISTLLVRPDLRRNGLGKRLIHFAARQISGKLVFINVPGEDMGTRRLLEHCGLRIFCEQLEMKREL